MSYIVPEPTTDMIILAEQRKFDPNNTLGALPIWCLRRDDTLAAAGLIHDFMYIRGGTKADYKILDNNFKRDALILAEAVDDTLIELFEISKAKLFAEIVFLLGSQYWHSDNWHTKTTWAQAKPIIRDAQAWINIQANKIGKDWPYPILLF